MTTVVVTGAASGIGKELTARLRAAGATVIGVDLRGTDIVADLSTVEGRAHAVAEVLRLTDGRVDGLVPCAGLAPVTGRPGSAIVSVNYFGSVAILDGLRPALAANASADAPTAAVAISSNATTCTPGVPLALVDACLAGDEARALALADEAGGSLAYAASKIAVARWVRSRAVTGDWTGAGIRLNAVAPGMTDTPMVAEGRADPNMAPLLDMFPIPLGRPGRAGEIAALIAFLLGPDAGFFCGSIVFCDGGTDALLRTNDWPARWDLDVSQLSSAMGADPAG